MPKLFAGLFCCFWSFSLLAQNPTGTLVPPDKMDVDTSGKRDIIGVGIKLLHLHIKKKPKVNGQRVYYSIIPLGTSVPGGGEALITATNAAFVLGDDPKNTFLSNVTFSPSTNLRGEWNVPFHSNIWSPKNKWNFEGDYRLTYFPQYTWGLGGNTAPSNKELVRYTYIRFYQSALRRIANKPFLFAGIGYNLDYHINIRPDNDSVNLTKFTGYKYGTGNGSNSFSSGLSFNLLYDTRNNSLNPLPGWFYNIVVRANPKLLGSDNNWYSLYVDARKYISFDPNRWNVLAFWSYLWTTMGTSAPYLDLPAITWDANQRSGRGFYPSRYTGKTLFDFETEYRRSITRDELLGFVVFASVNSVTQPHTSNFSYVHGAAGAGIRIKFNKHSGTNFGCDFAASKGYDAVYFSLGEAF
jgi:outer membrane protein assembly factor BamA